MKYDTEILVIGAGPAGAQAAVHALGRNRRVIVTGKREGSSLLKAHIGNYWAVPDVAPGPALFDAGLEQVRRLGGTVLAEDVTRIGPDGDRFFAEIESGDAIASSAVVLAPGVHRKRLGARGEEGLVGRGVSYCVDCDAGFFRGKRVAIFGDGSAAGEGALVLSRFASAVTLMCPGDRLGVSDALWERIKGAGIDLWTRSRVVEVVGPEVVTAVLLKDGRRLDVDGLFIELGAKGVLDLCAGLGVPLDENGFLPTDRDQATVVPGVFAAGDACGPPFQVAKAVGEGCRAGLAAADYIDSLPQG